MFFQPPEEESQVSSKPLQNTHRRKRKRKLANKSKRLAVSIKRKQSRFASSMSSWAENFTHAATWQLKHQIAYWKSRARALEYENKILHDIIRKNYSNMSEPESYSGCTVSESNSKIDIDEQKCEDETENNEENETNDHINNDYDDNNYESENIHENEDNFEVSEEFIQFLTANAKFKEDARLERERLKAEHNENNIINEMEAGPSETKENIEESQKSLYGDKWERIAALEISLQSQFINDSDKDKPIHWPNIPFNFNFS